MLIYFGTLLKAGFIYLFSLVHTRVSRELHAKLRPFAMCLNFQMSFYVILMQESTNGGGGGGGVLIPWREKPQFLPVLYVESGKPFEDCSVL